MYKRQHLRLRKARKHSSIEAVSYTHLDVYKRQENPVFDFAEHLYVGLAAGQAIVMGWLLSLIHI